MASTAPISDRDETGSRALEGAIWYVALVVVFAAIAAAIVVATGAPPTLLAFALALPPALIALGLARREGDGAAGRLARQLRKRPGNPKWYLVLLIPLGAFLAVDIVAIALGESPSGLFDGLFPAVVIVPIVVLIPAFAEEIGWRGYALPRALTAMSPLRAAIILGIPWALIHVPLYVPGQMNSGSSLWSMFTQVVSFSVILTWVYLGTGGSVLITGLFHTLLNGLTPLTNGIDPFVAWDIRGIVFPVVAILVIALGGLRRMGMEGSTEAVLASAAPRAAGS